MHDIFLVGWCELVVLCECCDWWAGLGWVVKLWPIDYV